MDIEESESELKKVVKEGEDEGIMAYRKAYKLDYDELKLFTIEVFGINVEMDDVKNIIINPLTEVVSPLEREANGELKNRLPVILFGIISLLELSQTNSCNFLREHLLNLSERYSSDSFGKTITKFFSNTKNLKLLFYERKDYSPPQLCQSLLSNLNDSIKNIHNDDHFLFISKIFKATKRNDENKKKKTIIHLHTEDSKFAEQATDYLEYPVDPRNVSGFPKWGCPFAPDKWNPKDYTDAEPWRIIYLIKLNRLGTIYKNLKDQFNL